MEGQSSDTTKNVVRGTIDELLSKAGLSGVVQIAAYVGVFLFGLTVVCQLGLAFFTGYSPPWKCVVDPRSDFCQKHGNITFTVDMEAFNHRCHLNRTEWTYAVAEEKYSVVTEFDLVCEKTPTATLIPTMFYIGCTLGALLCGPAGDTYGRKPTIVALIALTNLASIVLGYSERIWLMCLLQFVRGIGISSVYPVYVYLSEVSPPEFRSTAISALAMTGSLSYVLMDVLAMFLQNWRKISIYLGFVGIPSLVSFSLLPESPRWLLAKGRHAETKAILSKIFRFKGDAGIHIHKGSPKDTQEVHTYWHLINNCKALKLTLSIAFIWSVLPILYYTIGAQSLTYGGNMYINYMLATIPDIPASLVVTFLVNRIGRKKTTLACCTGSGLFIGAVDLVPSSTVHRRLIILGLTFLSKLFCMIAFCAIFIWTPEIFPTVLRAQAMAFCGTFERIAMICVPLICTFLQNISYSIPFILMCVLGVLGSLVGLLLPETKDQPTKDTYLQPFAKVDETLGKKGTFSPYFRNLRGKRPFPPPPKTMLMYFSK